MSGGIVIGLLFTALAEHFDKRRNLDPIDRDYYNKHKVRDCIKKFLTIFVFGPLHLSMPV